MKHASPLVLFVSIGLAAGCAGVKQNPGSGNGGSGPTSVSSWRLGMTDPATGDPSAPLSMTAVVTSEFGVRTYPAVYLWNQPANTSNFTPAWDVFKIGSVG